MITADQILAHAAGDYVIQSSWMASQKTSRSFPAAVHAVTYALPFLLLGPSIQALLVVVLTHFAIDRWRLARMVVWLRNFIGPGNRPWKECAATGECPDRPPWLAVWLLIIVDNTIHLAINGLALAYL